MCKRLSSAAAWFAVDAKVSRRHGPLGPSLLALGQASPLEAKLCVDVAASVRSVCAMLPLVERRHGFTMPLMPAMSQESARDVVVVCVVAAALSPVGDVSAARPGVHPRPKGEDAMPVTTSRRRRRLT